MKKRKTEFFRIKAYDCPFYPLLLTSNSNFFSILSCYSLNISLSSNPHYSYEFLNFLLLWVLYNKLFLFRLLMLTSRYSMLLWLEADSSSYRNLGSAYKLLSLWYKPRKTAMNQTWLLFTSNSKFLKQKSCMCDMICQRLVEGKIKQAIPTYYKSFKKNSSSALDQLIKLNYYFNPLIPTNLPLWYGFNVVCVWHVC